MSTTKFAYENIKRVYGDDMVKSKRALIRRRCENGEIDKATANEQLEEVALFEMTVERAVVSADVLRQIQSILSNLYSRDIKADACPFAFEQVVALDDPNHSAFGEHLAQALLLMGYYSIPLGSCFYFENWRRLKQHEDAEGNKKKLLEWFPCLKDTFEKENFPSQINLATVESDWLNERARVHIANFDKEVGRRGDYSRETARYGILASSDLTIPETLLVPTIDKILEDDGILFNARVIPEDDPKSSGLFLKFFLN